MLKTYMDCLYYEQLQFAMDTRLEALYTYAVSPDVQLHRKALLDFHYGMLPDGLTPGKYPSAYLQVLSTFSQHYVMMLWEYYVQTGDASTVRLCRGGYEELRECLNDWIGLLELDCTTCPETPHASRSDCHAWSALPMYEMMRTIAGVKNIGIAWNKVVIAPHMLDLPDVSSNTSGRVTQRSLYKQ